MFTATVRGPARAEATILIRPAFGSASATQPTTRMKGGTRIGTSASTPTSLPPGMSVLVDRNESPTPSTIARPDDPTYK